MWELLARLVKLAKSPKSLRGYAKEAIDARVLRNSRLFDERYYTSAYLVGSDPSLDPLLHYLRHGAAKGYNPSSEFDSKFYLARHADVRRAGINPLLHYVLHGRFENREISKPAEIAVRSAAPDFAEWQRLAEDTAALNFTDATIDVIVPVYAGYHETANCLFQVVKSRLVNKTSFELLVVDDASPEPELSDLLDRIASLNLLTLLRNRNNVGFVSSVNRGMEHHLERDVILLNADTEVYSDWIDRLRDVAYSQSNIGTVTPLSNNATICSYPRFASGFDASFEISFSDIDDLAAAANRNVIVDVPTAVGFCMYIRRECLDEVGLFDAKTFGLGYGEENDFSKRIAARGWRNVLAGCVFVRHLGSVSFQEDTSSRVASAVAVINRKYPGYDRQIANYIAADPPRRLRQNLDIARLRRAGGQRNILFLTHNLGGGTFRHITELAGLLAKEHVGVFILRPDAESGYGEIYHTSVRDLSVIGRINIRQELGQSIELMRELNVQHIHVHHVLGFGAEINDFVRLLAKGCGIQFDFTFHDYYPACPRLDMIDGSGLYCNTSDLTRCESCVRHDGPAVESNLKDTSVWYWRETSWRLLESARAVYVPDKDTADHIARFWPQLAVTVRPHPEPVPSVTRQPRLRSKTEPLRVAIIGALSKRKGADILEQCVKDAVVRKLPIEFVVVGYTSNTKLADFPNVTITGSFKEAELSSILERLQCHIAFFPSVWPETYSYTLSQAIFSGLYPVAFDIGAIARRTVEMGWGRILPYDLVTQPHKINEELLSTEPTATDAHWRPILGEARFASIIKDYYELEWGDAY